MSFSPSAYLPTRRVKIIMLLHNPDRVFSKTAIIYSEFVVRNANPRMKGALASTTNRT